MRHSRRSFSEPHHSSRKVFCFFLAMMAVMVSNVTVAQPSVYVGTYLHDVSAFEMQSGTYEVDVEMWLKWRGDFDASQLRIANASDVQRIELGEEHDSDWHSQRFRIRGTFRGKFPMHDFPFDSQQISVDVELPEEYGRLVPDLAASGMAESFSVTDWSHVPEFEPTVRTRTVRSDLGIIAREGKATRIHQTRFAVSLNRPIITVALKLFLPLSIIILVAFIALFLSHEVIAPRASIGVTALLSCFAFQFTVVDMVPAVGYLTFADTLFLIGYMFSCLALVSTVVSHAFFRRGEHRVSSRIDVFARIALPLASSVAIFVTLPKPQAREPETPRAFFEEAAQASAKETLNVGLTRMPNFLASAFARGTQMDLVETSQAVGGQARALLAERVPGVDNDALRFSASGELEVTWRLREGLMWSNGKPVTAQDLSFPWTASPSAHVKSVATPDDRTLVVTWNEKVSEALLSPSVLPYDSLKDAFDTGGYKAMRKLRRNMPLPGLGPYRLESKSKDSATMVRNEHYIGNPANIRRVVVKKYPSSEALTQAFLKDEVDITPPNAISMEDALRIQKTKPAFAEIVPSAIVVVLSPDLSHPLLGSLKARAAILSALDRRALARSAYGDAGRVAHIPVVGALPQEAKRYELDVAGAKSVLMSFPKEHRSFPLYAAAGSEPSRVMAEGISTQLGAVGVDVKVEYVERVEKLYKSHAHGGVVLHPMMGRRDSHPGRYWNLPIVDGEYQKDYRSSAYQDDIASLINHHAHSLYPERSAQLRDTLIGLTTTRLPNLPLVFTAQRQAANPSLWRTPSAPDDYFGEGIHRWYFEE